MFVLAFPELVFAWSFFDNNVSGLFLLSCNTPFALSTLPLAVRGDGWRIFLARLVIILRVPIAKSRFSCFVFSYQVCCLCLCLFRGFELVFLGYVS